MNGFYVITNRSKKTAAKEAAFIKEYLENRGCACYLQSECACARPDGMRYTDASAIPEDVECIIALGGDGTLLHASRDLVDMSLPLLGVNLGTLGYLAEIELANIAPTLDRLIADDFFIEDRMMLQGTVVTSDREKVQDIALNDIVISRRGRLRVVDFNVYVDDVFLCSYRADGIIVSTSFDGDTFLVPENGGRIVISKSEKKTHFIRMNHTSFVENLREKLGP